MMARVKSLETEKQVLEDKLVMVGQDPKRAAEVMHILKEQRKQIEAYERVRSAHAVPLVTQLLDERTKLQNEIAFLNESNSTYHAKKRALQDRVAALEAERGEEASNAVRLDEALQEVNSIKAQLARERETRPPPTIVNVEGDASALQ